MIRGRGWSLVVGALTVSACGQGQLSVTAELEVEDPDQGTVMRPLSDLEVRLYPFDRDLVFDSLTQAASTPEPPIPDTLLQAQAAVAAAQNQWRTAEEEWQTLRDNLQRISNELEGLNRGESRYVTLFNEFRDMEGRLGSAERRMESAFQRFNDLQSSIIAQMDEVRLRREGWADEAFAEVGLVFDAKMQETGRPIVYDTTDASGTALVELPRGQWWVFARHELPFNELYWNVQVNVEGSEPVVIRLSRENAQVRPKI